MCARCALCFPGVIKIITAMRKCLDITLMRHVCSDLKKKKNDLRLLFFAACDCKLIYLTAK